MLFNFSPDSPSHFSEVLVFAVVEEVEHLVANVSRVSPCKEIKLVRKYGSKRTLIVASFPSDPLENRLALGNTPLAHSLVRVQVVLLNGQLVFRKRM